MKVFTEDKWLSSADFARLTKGNCPNCQKGVEFLLGPRGGLARNVVCPNCMMEYSASPAGAQVINDKCPLERLEQFYFPAIGEKLKARVGAKLREQKMI